MGKMVRFSILLLSLIYCMQAGLAQELPLEGKQWLEEEVVYIITPKERKVFLSLKSNRERDVFKRAFWIQRDPTFGTEKNEFKDEHYRRLTYAQTILGRGSVRPGWQTDRGRFYIILGAPVDIQRYMETSQNLVTCELWQYQGDTSLGLPPFFYIIFYQERGSSEYKLYSPSFDGPQRLTQQSFQATTSERSQAYQQIKEVSAELADASLSYIPGSGEDPYSSTSSLSSDILISNIQNLPAKRVRTEWADAFARAKEVITTDYSVNYVSSDSVLFTHQENGKYYIHAIIEPRRLSLSQVEQKVVAPLMLNVAISDSSGKMIHQEEKNVQIEVSPEDFNNIQHRLSAIGDVIPTVEGTFSLRLLLRNLESKEFSSLEEKIFLPSAAGKPSLSPLLLLYREKEIPGSGQTIPFLISGHQLYPNTHKDYTANENLLVYFEIYNPSSELSGCHFSYAIIQDEKILSTQTESVGSETSFLKRFPLKDFKAGYYKFRVSLVDVEEKEMLTSESDFMIAAIAGIPRPWIFNRTYPPLDHPYFSYIRAIQYLGLGQNDQVIKELEKFYVPLKPHKDFALVLGKAYFNNKDYLKTIAILDSLKESQDLEILILLGRSYLEALNYDKAVDIFIKALTTGGEIVELLNLLGYGYFKLDDAPNALKYLERSLKINPDQPNIKQLMEKIRPGA